MQDLQPADGQRLRRRAQPSLRQCRPLRPERQRRRHLSVGRHVRLRDAVGPKNRLVEVDASR